MRHLHHQHTGNARLEAIDPRIRLLAAGLLLALVVSSRNSTFPWFVALACLPTSLFCGMGLPVLLLRLLHPLFIAAMILALKTFMGGDGTLLLNTAAMAVAISHQGFAEGLLIVSRIMGAVSVAVLLSQTMSFTEAMAALRWLRAPAGLVEVCLFAWRSLFMFYDNAGVVYTAQKNRLGYCGLRRSLKSFGAMAGMLTIKALDSSQAITLAMTQRGYDGTMPFPGSSRPSWYQIACLGLFSLAMTIAWTLQN